MNNKVFKEKIISYLQERIPCDSGKSVWKMQSSCRDKDIRLFFPQKRKNQLFISPEIKNLCTECPVKFHCLKEAVENNEHGIWCGEYFTEEKKSSILEGIMRKIECDAL